MLKEAMEKTQDQISDKATWLVISVFVVLSCLIQVSSKAMEAARRAVDSNLAAEWLFEISSHAAILAATLIIPYLLYRFPLSVENWNRRWPVYFLGFIGSIHFYQADKIEKLSEIHLLKDYLATKKQEIAEHSQRLALEDSDYVNQRKLTNVGTFRAYITEFLQDHEKVHHQMTCMVRQLPATATGLPLELYFFSNDQNWGNYEAIQADIFDHLFAMAPIFDLRIFQHPSGDDWRQR